MRACSAATRTRLSPPYGSTWHAISLAFSSLGSKPQRVAAKKNDTKALTSTLQGLASSDGVKKIAAAQRELQAKGITVGTTGGEGGS